MKDMKHKNNGHCKDTSPEKVEDINKRNQKHPAEPSKNKEKSSYEERTLLDGVGSSYDEDERLDENCLSN